jgi:FkbM family methyltransferase
VREELWLKLRQSPILRKLYNQPLLAPAMRTASNLLLPSWTEKILKVKSGIGEGLAFELNPRWEIELWEGSYEPGVQEIAREYFVPGKTYYDVGGGIGFYSLVAARGGAQVYTFEPDPQNHACIERHAKRNRLDGRFHLMQLAAYSHTGQIQMQHSTKDRGHGHAKTTFDGTVPGPGFEVSCTTLDDFARSHPLPTLVKVDVEGAEVDVVKGAGWLLGEIRPAILCEVHNLPISLQIQELLRGHGYRWQWLDDPTYPICRLFATFG